MREVGLVIKFVSDRRSVNGSRSDVRGRRHGLCKVEADSSAAVPLHGRRVSREVSRREA